MNAIERLRDAIESFDYSSSAQVDSQVREYRSNMNLANSDWERQAYILNHKKELIETELNLAETNLMRIQDEISFDTALLVSLESRIVDIESSLLKYERRQRIATQRLDLAYANRRH